MLAAGATLSLPYSELVGPPGAPVIVALGGISAYRHVCANARDSHRGWWDGVAGDGAAIDTNTFGLLSIDWLDGGDAGDGRPASIITTHDQADALAAILESHEIRHVHAIVGASYGGMVALAFADAYPHLVDRLIVFGAAHRAHPMTTAIRTIQRRIVEEGIASGRIEQAMSVARQLAMTTYRSRREFLDRFDVTPVTRSAASATFDVERYLVHQGGQFARTWKPSRFLSLSLSADLHVVDPTTLTTPVTFIAAEDDGVVPRSDMEEFALSASGTCRIVDLATIHGHDAFLTDTDAIGAIIRTVLDS